MMHNPVGGTLCWKDFQPLSFSASGFVP